jgi:two-component system chemotaxis response regulator CheY
MNRKNLKLPPDLDTEIILVVEDSPTDQLILKRILETWGFHVLVAGDGQEGVDFLNLCVFHRLNLVGIISDIIMPNMDGMAFLRKVRRHRGMRKMPFLFLTGANDNFYVIDAKKNGASGFLVKPIAAPVLLAKFKEFFPQRGFGEEKAAA